MNNLDREEIKAVELLVKRAKRGDAEAFITLIEPLGEMDQRGGSLFSEGGSSRIGRAALQIPDQL